MVFQFESLNDFVMMSGHGPYVWASYLMTLASILLLVVIPLQQRKRHVLQLQRAQKLEEVRYSSVDTH